MHDDPAGGDQLTVDELTGLLAALILSDSYYCDQGSHYGRTRVLLDGYLTDRQVSLLRTAHHHHAGDAAPRQDGELDTRDRCRYCGVLLAPGTGPLGWMHRPEVDGPPRSYLLCGGPASRDGRPAQPLAGHTISGGTVVAHRQARHDTVLLVLAPAATADRYITARWQPGWTGWEHGRCFTGITAAVTDWATR